MDNTYSLADIASATGNENGNNNRGPMMNNQLDERNRQLVEAQNALNNAQQTQTILANLGRFVAWAGSGTATTGVSSV